MKRVTRITESDINNIVKKVMKEWAFTKYGELWHNRNKESENQEDNHKKDIIKKVDAIPDKDLYVLSMNVDPEYDGKYTNGITFEEGLVELIKRVNPKVSDEGLSRVKRNNDLQSNLKSKMDGNYFTMNAVKEFLVDWILFSERF